MAVKQYRAIRRGYYGGTIREPGEVFYAEFLGIERDKAGAPVVKDGETVRKPIDAPSWVEEVSKAEANAAAKADASADA